MNIIEVKKENLFDSIVCGIKEIFPAKKPRVSFNNDSSIKEEILEIEFYYNEDRTGKVTRFIYLKNNDKKIKGFVLYDKISEENIKRIYKYVLTFFSYIKKVSYQEGEYRLKFGIDKNEFYSEGIGCSDIVLKFGVNSNLSKKINNEIFSLYECFVNEFDSLLDRFSRQKARIKYEYCCFKKRNIIDNMSNDELDEFYDFIDDDILKSILKTLKISKFFELLYNKFKMRFPVVDRELMNNLIDRISINDIKEMIDSLEETEKRDVLKAIKVDNFFELYRYFKSKDNSKDRDYLKKALSVKKTGNGK